MLLRIIKLKKIKREVIIPRSEIITFRKFNKEVFDYFHKEDYADSA